jgi:hypothetical protein
MVHHLRGACGSPDAQRRLAPLSAPPGQEKIRQADDVIRMEVRQKNVADLPGQHADLRESDGRAATAIEA